MVAGTGLPMRFAAALMFSLTGQPSHAWDGKLPGYPAFEVVQDAVAACHPAQTKTATAKTTSLLWAALHGLVIGRGRGAVDVKRRPGVVCLRVDELESQRRGKAIEQGKPIAECDRLQDEAVLVDELQPTK